MVVSTTEDFKKMSIKEMDRKEKRKAKRRDGDITPRKGQLGLTTTNPSCLLYTRVQLKIFGVYIHDLFLSPVSRF